MTGPDEGDARMADEEPTGHVAVDDSKDDAGGRALDRWLRPDVRRPVAVGLLVAAVVVSSVVAGPVFELPLGPPGESWQLALWLTGAVTGLALLAALMLLVWTGSRAGRLLGAVVALDGSLQLLFPLVVLQVPPSTFGPYAVPYLAAVVLYLAALVSLLRPARG